MGRKEEILGYACVVTSAVALSFGGIDIYSTIRGIENLPDGVRRTYKIESRIEEIDYELDYSPSFRIPLRTFLETADQESLLVDILRSGKNQAQELWNERVALKQEYDNCLMNRQEIMAGRAEGKRLSGRLSLDFLTILGGYFVGIPALIFGKNRINAWRRMKEKK